MPTLPKTTTSAHSDKRSRRNVPGRNANNSPGTKAHDARSDRGENLPTPLEDTAAAAASLPPPGEAQPVGLDKPIAKLADSSHQKNDSIPSQEVNPSTPPVSLVRQLEEEHQSKPAEVTFMEKAAAPSVGVIASVPSKPRNSRRHKARSAKLSGRTSESFSRDDQAFFMWEDSTHDLLFRDSSEPGGDPIARAPLTLASGRYIKAGDSLDKSLVDIHLRQLRDDLTFDQREVILRGHPKPPAKKERDKRAAKSTASRKSKSRRRDPQHLTDDSDSDNDSRSVSILSNASNVSKNSEVSKHSGKYTTMDPDGKDQPMQSPIQLEEGRFIHRREHVNSAQHTNAGAVVALSHFLNNESPNICLEV